ncbi:MAG: Transcription elongation factor, greA/greB family [Nitrospira sp.]|jgi:regulator of nucleoside diphosphate kinase|nr:Transcription elongation factor, greA/greB family [Nitrospira sp.]
MSTRDIYITEFDLTRLRDVLSARINAKVRDRDHLESLQNELDRAHVVDTSAIPHDVVTMNSQVRIEDVDTGMENVYTLVFPTDASIPDKKISILAPIGTALLGSRAGGTVDWPVPAGMRTVRIKEVLYQPEAAGDYHL